MCETVAQDPSVLLNEIRAINVSVLLQQVTSYAQAFEGHLTHRELLDIRKTAEAHLVKIDDWIANHFNENLIAGHVLHFIRVKLTIVIKYVDLVKSEISLENNDSRITASLNTFYDNF